MAGNGDKPETPPPEHVKKELDKEEEASRENKGNGDKPSGGKPRP